MEYLKNDRKSCFFFVAFFDFNSFYCYSSIGMLYIWERVNEYEVFLLNNQSYLINVQIDQLYNICSIINYGTEKRKINFYLVVIRNSTEKTNLFIQNSIIKNRLIQTIMILVVLSCPPTKDNENDSKDKREDGKLEAISIWYTLLMF